MLVKDLEQIRLLIERIYLVESAINKPEFKLTGNYPELVARGDSEDPAIAQLYAGVVTALREYRKKLVVDFKAIGMDVE